MYKNIVVTVSNYATHYLNDTLREYGEAGYKLVNVVMADNEYGCKVMYLFFIKELEVKNKSNQF